MRTITAAQAADMNPWELAQQLSTNDCTIQFTGDMNPFDHGGTWYETANWNRYGYSSCVRMEDIEGRTLVSCGTINRLEGDDMESAHRCGGTPEEFRNTTVGEIEACLYYAGAEPVEDFSGRYERWFDEGEESHAWEIALSWIMGLTRS